MEKFSQEEVGADVEITSFSGLLTVCDRYSHFLYWIDESLAVRSFSSIFHRHPAIVFGKHLFWLFALIFYSDVCF